MTFIFMVCFCISVQEQAFSIENSKKMLPGLFNIVKIVLLMQFLDQNKTSIIRLVSVHVHQLFLRTF